MADNEEDKSLADFFSKKEKSKKTKGKGTEKKQLKAKTKTTTQKKSASSTQGESVEHEQEWEDFKDPEEKDYSGLRIQALQIVEGEKDKDEDTASGDGDDDENGLPKKESSSGVWQNFSGQQQPAVSPAPTPSENDRQSQQRYVPGSFGKRKKPTNPPDIDSQAAFPSLSSSVSMDKNADKARSDFEVVKKGTKSKDGSMGEGGLRLDLGNRYDSLRN